MLLLLASIIFAVAPVYLFVMPRLSSGVEILALIFVYSFLCSLAGARSPAVKMALLAVFVLLTGISNQQTYSFIGLVNGAMMFILAQGLVTIVYMLCKLDVSQIYTQEGSAGVQNS